MGNRNLFDDGMAGACPEQEPILAPALAKRYRAVARQVALEGDEALAKRMRPSRDDPRVAECRTFLQALSAARGDGFPILFNAVMRELVVAAHAGRGRRRFPERLFGCRTAFETKKGKGIRNALGKSFSVTPGKKGDFPMLPAVMGRLFVLNSLGYDIHVAANAMLFNHRCKMTCPTVRILVVELDNSSLAEQERLLDAITPMVAAAVFSGKRSIHMFVPLSRPIRNPKCVRASDWQAFRVIKVAGGLDFRFRIPDFERATDALRKVVVDASGREPDLKVLGNFASLTRAPGFRHGETGRLSTLLHVDHNAKWDNPAPQPTMTEDESPIAMAVWEKIGSEWERDSSTDGRSGSTVTITHPSQCMKGDGVDERKGTKGTTGPQGDGGIPPFTTTEKKEEEALSYSPPSSPLPDPVLNKDVINYEGGVPKRTFFDDMDEFEALLVKGMPARHQRIRFHGVVMNAARILGWIPDGDAPDVWSEARVRLMGVWGGIVTRTPECNIGMPADEAALDFGRHLDSSASGGKLGAFRPRMPDFTTLPQFGDHRATARGIRKKIIAMMEAGILPSPEGGVGMRRHVASGAARIIVEVLCPLARRVPKQCLEGVASIPAVRMQGMCPSRKYKPVVRWLAEANILWVTRTHARWDESIGCGRTCLYRVNLPLVVWLAGVRKESLSWAAHKGSGAPHMASKGAGAGKDAT